MSNAKPCTKCGGVIRYANGACQSCSKKATAKWQEANKDKVKKKNAAWRAENADSAREKKKIWYANNIDMARANHNRWLAENPNNSAEWYAKNAEEHKARGAAWRKENPELCRLYSHNYRARKLKSGGKLSKGLHEKLFRLQRGKCACGCKQPLGDDYHMDHKMPLALGGANEDWNMQLLRAKCNLQKQAKHPVDFMQQRGYLL